MKSIRRILACVQFNESRETMVDYACALAERFHSELHLLHVFEDIPRSDVIALPPHEAAYAAGGADAVLAGIIPEEWEQRLLCRKEVVFGVPRVEISRYAWEQQVDLIVLGASSRTALGRWMWGSVSDQLVHRPPCPVLIIPRRLEREFPLP